MKTVARARVGVFGDSHYGCLRLADGLLDLSAIDFEYWGHIGRRFRMLEYHDGAIHPKDDFTAARFAKFNAKSRRFLPARDFDYILFMGCRIDLSLVFIQLLDALVRGQFLSSGLQHAMVRARLAEIASYDFARQMAGLNHARILVHPVTMTGFGTSRYDDLIHDSLRRSSSAARDQVWQVISDVMAEDQIILLPQLDHTFAQGIYTDKAYLIDGYDKNNDFTHRNAAYGVLVWRQLLDVIAQQGDAGSSAT